MKSYYYYLRNAESTDPNQVLYKVAVGRSEREQIKLSLLENFALDTGGFLRQVDEDSDFYLFSRSAQLFPSSRYPMMMWKNVQINISHLYRMIMDDTIGHFERELEMPKSYFFQLSSLLPSYFTPRLHQVSLRPASQSPRKYLSNKEEVSPRFVAISCAIVVALFLFAGWLEGLERTLY